MNTRLSMRELATYIKSLPAFAAVTVDTIYAHDYVSRVVTAMPAVWIIGQNSTRIDEGRAYTQKPRQRMRVEIAIRIVVPRVTANVPDAEPALTTLQNAVSDALFAWMPTGAEDHFVWVSANEGRTFDTVVTSVLVFSTTVVFTD